MIRWWWVVLGIGCQVDKATSDAALSRDTGTAATDTGPGDTDTDPPPDTDPPIDTGDSGASTPEPFTPTLPTAGCGVGDYDWLPTDTMGDILDWEAVPEFSMTAEAINLLLAAADLGGVAEAKYGVDLYKVRYRTQDKGEETDATGFLAFPKVEEPTVFPLMLWLHPTMGFSDACAPTVLGVEGAAFPILFATQGFAVAAPDQLGMKGWGEPSAILHPYVVAEPTAIVSLDAARALVKFQAAEGLQSTGDPAQLLHWGVSEGGFSALWTDRYQPGYAPEFDPIGVIAAIPPTDPVALAHHAMTEIGPTTKGLAAVIVTALQWYRSDMPLTDVFTDETPFYFASSLEEDMASKCWGFPIDDITQINHLYTESFIDGILTFDWDAIDPFGCIAEENTLRDSAVPHDSEAPVLMIIAEDDDLTIADPARDDVVALCELGYTIEHMECAGTGHTGAAVNTILDQVAWALDRVAGVPLDEDNMCVINAPIECEELLPGF
jgi:hypothetical protein